MSTQGDITGLLDACARGETGAEDRLLPVVYDELRRLARGQRYRRPGGRRAGATLNTTALAHEAYLKLFGGAPGSDFRSRGHFLAVAATAMRHILVDAARERLAVKRGAGADHLPLDSALRASLASEEDDRRRLAAEILDLDEALGRLTADQPRQARVVELHFFAGMTFDQVGEALGISTPTAKRDWWQARDSLYRDMAHAAEAV